MTTLLKLEELGVFFFSIFLFLSLPYPWWLFPILLFAPDLSMVGYFASPAIGALTYNIIHHRGIALTLYVSGELMHLQLLGLVGVIMLAHASLDRVFGYGLKYSDKFTHTHLGMIGQASDENRGIGSSS